MVDLHDSPSGIQIKACNESSRTYVGHCLHSILLNLSTLNLVVIMIRHVMNLLGASNMHCHNVDVFIQKQEG